MAFGRDTSEIRASVTADTRGLQREFKAATQASDRLAVGVDKANVKLKQAEVAAGKAAAAHKRAAEAFGRDSKQSYEAALRASKANIRVKESTLDVADAQDKLHGSTQKVDAAGRRASGTWAKASGALRNVARNAGLAVAAVAGMGAIGAAAGLKRSIDDASSLNEEVNKSRVVFGKLAPAIERFADRSARALGQSKRETLGAIGTFGNLFIAMGIGEKQAAGMSTKMATLASDLASFNNMDPSEVLERLRSGLLGEQEAMEVLGVSISETALKNKAFQMGLTTNTKSVLPQNIKTQAAYQLILDQTGKAQGDFARTSGSAANQQRIFAAQMENLRAKLGQKLLPAFTQFLTWVNAKLIPGLEKFWKEHGPGISKAFSEISRIVRDELLPKLQSVGQFLKDEFTPAFNALKQAFLDNKPEILFFARMLTTALLPALAAVATVGLVAVVVALRGLIGYIKIVVRGFQGLVIGYTTGIQKMLEAAASAADAIGMKGLAARLRSAASSVARFRDDVNKAIDGVITYKEIIVKGAAVFMNGAPSQARGMKRGINDFEPSKRASGGMIRGAGTATSDSIPAWLSNGEFVMNAKATSAIGPGNLYAMQAAAARYASGGLARMPGFAGGGILHPRVQSDTTKFAAGINAFDKQVTNRAIQMAKQMATALGGLDGPGSWKWQMSVLRQAFPGLPLISGFRPGAITATGRRSYHASGRAVDIPPRMDVFNWIRANYGARTKELIFSPAGGRQLHNGSPHVYTGVTRAMHYNHVHWAFRNGGLVPALARGGLPAGTPLTLGSPGRGWRFDQARQMSAGIAGGKGFAKDFSFKGMRGRFNNDALASAFYRQYPTFNFRKNNHGTRMFIVNWLKRVQGIPYAPYKAPPKVPGRIGGNAMRVNHFLSRMSDARRMQYARRYGLPKATRGYTWAEDATLITKRPGQRHAQGGLVPARTYDSGGWLQPGATLAINNTGRPERITPAGGGTQVIVLKVDGRELARVVNDQNVRSGRLA